LTKLYSAGSSNEQFATVEKGGARASNKTRRSQRKNTAAGALPGQEVDAIITGLPIRKITGRTGKKGKGMGETESCRVLKLVDLNIEKNECLQTHQALGCGKTATREKKRERKEGARKKKASGIGEKRSNYNSRKRKEQGHLHYHSG